MRPRFPPLGRHPSPWQAMWRNKIEQADSLEKFEQVIQEFTRECLSKPRGRRRHAARGTHCDPKEAQRRRIRSLYHYDKARALKEIVGPSPDCEIPAETLEAYFKAMFDRQDRPTAPRPVDLSQLPRIKSPVDLKKDFTLQEVREMLQSNRKKKKKDRILQRLLEEGDDGCQQLAAIFNWCLRKGCVPSAWKKATTIPIFKNGPLKDPSNWRPIFLCDSLYKMYARCIAHRITEWAKEGKAISPEQKGFSSFHGQHEHTFLLRSVLDDTWHAQRECAVAKLDLANAFGSVWHHHIFDTLSELGMPKESCNVLRELYRGCTTTVRTKAGETPAINLQVGLKQGCPLSHIIFHLTMEPFLRYIVNGPGGFDLYGQKVNVLAYVDDLVLIAENEEGLQGMLDRASKAAEWMGLCFNVKKCIALHVRERDVLPSKFTIRGVNLTPLLENELFVYLGTHMYFPPRAHQSFENLFSKKMEEVETINASLLSHGQKMDALKSSLLPKISNFLREMHVEKQVLAKADHTIKGMVKRLSHSTDIRPQKDGGHGVLPLGDLSDTAVLAHAFCMLTCPNDRVKEVAFRALQDTVQKELKKTTKPTRTELTDYLNGTFSCDEDFSSLWSRARNATCRLTERITCTWVYDDQCGFCINIGQRTSRPRVWQSQGKGKETLEGILKKMLLQLQL